MRSRKLPAHLSLNCLSNSIISCSWCYFVSILLKYHISQKFNCDGQTDQRKDGRMDRPMDGWTDGQTDTTYLRDAESDLKMVVIWCRFNLKYSVERGWLMIMYERIIDNGCNGINVLWGGEKHWKRATYWNARHEPLPVIPKHHTSKSPDNVMQFHLTLRNATRHRRSLNVIQHCLTSCITKKIIIRTPHVIVVHLQRHT